MSSYKIDVDKKMTIKRLNYDTLQIEIDGKKARVKTEDLAYIVREELPEGRAEGVFDEMEEKKITKGKARIRLTAWKDVKKGDELVATIDMTRYADMIDSRADSARKAGLVIPGYGGVRTNNQGFIY